MHLESNAGNFKSKFKSYGLTINFVIFLIISFSSRYATRGPISLELQRDYLERETHVPAVYRGSSSYLIAIELSHVGNNRECKLKLKFAWNADLLVSVPDRLEIKPFSPKKLY